MVSGDADRVEVEIAGEKVVVEGWPDGLASPPRSGVSVNGELAQFSLESRSSGGRTAAVVVPAPSVTPTAAQAPGTPEPPVPPGAAGPGVSVFPPMPGKVVEVKVNEDEMVVSGQVLLVLEAMKMRNEVPSPLAGRVVDLRVVPGANVRTKEPMLRIIPV